MKIYLLRHGETDSNVNKIIQGTIDTELNGTGHKQAALLGQRMGAIASTHIFCSDLKRCRQTLAPVHAHQREPVPTVLYTPELQERYMAEIQGVSKETVERMCREQGKSKFDFGEGDAALMARVQHFWRGRISPLYESGTDGTVPIDTAGPSHPPRTTERVAFICSHGGTLLALTSSLRKVFGFSLAPGQAITRASPNTGVTIVDTDTMQIELYADVSHLTAMGADEAEREAKMEVVDV